MQTKSVLKFVSVAVAACVGLAGFSVGACAQQKEGEGTPRGDWLTYIILGQAPKEKLDKLADWINNTCKPDEMHRVTGIVSQGGGAGANYNIVAFCKKGGGKLGPVNVTAVPWTDSNQFADAILVGREAVTLLGFYDGRGGDAAFAVIKK